MNQKNTVIFKAAENQNYEKCRYVDVRQKGDRRLWRFTKRFTMEILIQDFSIGTYREEDTIYSRKRNEISINGMRE